MTMAAIEKGMINPKLREVPGTTFAASAGPKMMLMKRSNYCNADSKRPRAHAQ
jgi:hypothetical protein